MTYEETREYQLAQLELVKMVDELCSKLKLTYYIIGGTLLGAVRHGGFIPWDPDIDIAMPREDYEKMREYWLNNPSERYFYQHYSTEKNHISPHALIKIKNSHVVFGKANTRVKPSYDGIYLDIFPLDNPPEDKKLQEKQMKRIKSIRSLIYYKSGHICSRNNTIVKIIKHLISIFLSPISFRYLNKKMDRIMQEYNNPSSEYLVSMASHYSYWKQLMPKSMYGSPIRIDFEGIALSAPAKTDEYLTRLFGDYMELPPESHRTAMLDLIEKVEYSQEENK